MNYFEFYGLEESIDIDKAALKKLYYAFSKKYHPDYYSTASAEEKEKALELSSLNNDAYNTLRTEHSRIKYILDSHDLLEEGKNEIPQSFLMEMMDINELIMELEMDYEADGYRKAISLVDELEDGLRGELNGIKNEAESDIRLSKLKENYLKHQYLRRIKENLSKFASH